MTTCVAIGTFDGVHLGHLHMLGQARSEADEHAGSLTVATFWPHPRAVLREGPPPLLAGLEERVRLLHDAGANQVEVIEFSEQFSQMSPTEFVERWLLASLGATCVVVGANFRFGHAASGDANVLTQLCEQHGVRTHVVPLYEHDGAPVSSTRIRGLLEAGDVEEAAALLGRPYALDGEVVRGQQRGRELGIPTANLRWDATRMAPESGVYAGRADTCGATYRAAISVGTNPQFSGGGETVHIEAHLLDFAGDELYGEPMRLSFDGRVRGQEVFPTTDELVRQIHADIETVRAFRSAGAR